MVNNDEDQFVVYLTARQEHKKGWKISEIPT